MIKAQRENDVHTRVVDVLVLRLGQDAEPAELTETLVMFVWNRILIS